MPARVARISTGFERETLRLHAEGKRRRQRIDLNPDFVSDASPHAISTQRIGETIAE
jgi:hypothetical protein